MNSQRPSAIQVGESVQAPGPASSSPSEVPPATCMHLLSPAEHCCVGTLAAHQTRLPSPYFLSLVLTGAGRACADAVFAAGFAWDGGRGWRCALSHECRVVITSASDDGPGPARAHHPPQSVTEPGPGLWHAQRGAACGGTASATYIALTALHVRCLSFMDAVTRQGCRLCMFRCGRTDAAREQHRGRLLNAGTPDDA